jgi:MFS transporter, SP family, xylose:H+ symportor
MHVAANLSAPPAGIVFRSAVVAALGGLLFGFDTAVISGANQALTDTFGLSQFWLGFTVASALVGTVIASALIGWPADRLGRKKVLFGLAVAYFVSSVGCGLAPDWYTFLAARFLGGLAIGGASVVAPMYIAEVSPPAWRGRLVAVNQLNVVAGILLSYLSNYLIDQAVPSATAWRWMMGVVAVPSLVFFVVLFFIPESPRWLSLTGRSAAATRVLARLGVADPVAAEAAIRASIADELGGGREPLFQRRFARSIFLAWAIAMFNQLSGINALMYYAPTIFKMAGADPSYALLQSVAVGATNFLFTVIALFLIDRVGRRRLLLVGSVGLVACLATVAYEFGKGSPPTGPVVLAALLGYIAFFAFSQGAVIWVFISEVFPNAVRAKGQALGSFTHWFMAAAVSWTFPMAAGWPGLAFGFFAAMMVLQFVFAGWIMPETRGGELEDVEERLCGQASTRITDVH